MAKSAPKPVTACLDDNPDLGGLVARARLHQRLLEVIRQQLPAALRDHCVACVLNLESELRLYVDAASWASQVRYLAPRLLPAVRAVAPVKRLRVRVWLPVQPVTHKPKPPRYPQALTVERLQTQVQWVSEPEVRQALQRLLTALQARR